MPCLFFPWNSSILKGGLAGTDRAAAMPKTTNMQETRRDLEWNDLAIILAIGRAGSLSGAARALGKTHSTVFRNITAIEERTGVRFFDRFDHGYVPTDAGRTALDHAERVEGEFHALGIEILGKDTKLSGRIRVTCPEAFAGEHIPGLVARFVAMHPEIQVDVSPGHGAADLNRREAEIAIRATKAPPEASFGRKICPFRFALYSSPDYVETAPERPLAEHPFCLIEGNRELADPDNLEVQGTRGGPRCLSVPGIKGGAERRRRGNGADFLAVLRRRRGFPADPGFRSDRKPRYAPLGAHPP